ncbi:sister chromatid cohesion protein Dcc1 [Jimgerdemannia flammicorona]|uniref:Sister chromatid cohesion protein Dcc1 n=1 Tax=Jimgerdemannia flammicorona TaxID=994334 RepID=A0A433QF24_9FUNG|nr:sister chromatid cohesion protein Dcc1 [Jimgerdemannia flammicorona]
MPFQIRFHPTYNPHSYSLIELPTAPDEFPDCLSIKGLPDDDAVLCTNDTTYAVRNVQLSNSLLLISPSSDNTDDSEQTWSVHDNLSSIIELVRCLPRLERLNYLLDTNLYAGYEAESQHSQVCTTDQFFAFQRHVAIGCHRNFAPTSHGIHSDSVNHQASLYTWEDLQTLVQASDAELRKGLRDRNAILIDGHYRLLHPVYFHTVLDTLITSATAEDMPLEALRLVDCSRSLQEHDIPPEIVRHCLRSFSDPGEGWKQEDEGNDDEVYALSEVKVCQFLGLRLLTAERVREIMEPDRVYDIVGAHGSRSVYRIPGHAEGDTHVVTEGHHLLTYPHTDPSNPNARLITHFSYTDLPLDPARRFAELFAARKRWTADEIQPYIADLVVDKKKLDAVLLKHTRTVKEKGPSGQMMTVYTARMK